MPINNRVYLFENGVLRKNTYITPSEMNGCEEKYGKFLGVFISGIGKIMVPNDMKGDKNE